VTVLQFVRPKRKPAVFVPDPRRCHCPTIHHPVSPVERNVVEGLIARARAAGDRDHVGYLQLQLDTAHRCPAYAGPRCLCGCGRAPSEHNPMNGDAA